MNPFRIHKEEMNVEKTGFLKNLVLLIWKDTQGTVTKTEYRLVENVITDYYDCLLYTSENKVSASIFTLFSGTTAMAQSTAGDYSAGPTALSTVCLLYTSFW